MEEFLQQYLQTANRVEIQVFDGWNEDYDLSEVTPRFEDGILKFCDDDGLNKGQFRLEHVQSLRLYVAE